MPVHISAAHLARMRRTSESLMARGTKLRAKAEGAVTALVDAAEVGGASFAFGVIQGRYGAVDIVGVPVDLAAALGLHVLGFLGVGGKMNRHIHSFGNGALASYLSTLGRGAGLNMKSKALGTAVKGDGRKLTAAELEALAH